MSLFLLVPIERNWEPILPRGGSFVYIYVGISPSRRFARARLYRKLESNDSLDQWSVEYDFEGVLSAYFNARMPSSTPSFGPSLEPSSSSDPLISKAVAEVIGPCAIDQSSCDATATNEGVTWFINSTNNPENVVDEQSWRVSRIVDQAIRQLVFLFLFWMGGIHFIILT